MRGVAARCDGAGKKRGRALLAVLRKRTSRKVAQHALGRGSADSYAAHYSHFGDPKREADRVLGSSEAVSNPVAELMVASS